MFSHHYPTLQCPDGFNAARDVLKLRGIYYIYIYMVGRISKECSNAHLKTINKKLSYKLLWICIKPSKVLDVC